MQRLNQTLLASSRLSRKISSSLRLRASAAQRPQNPTRYEAENFSSLIASELLTMPPTRLVA